MIRSRIAVLLTVLLVAAFWARRTSETDADPPPGSTVGIGHEASAAGPSNPPAPLPCPTAGYLCAEPGMDGLIPIRRWRSDTGILVVHVPLPPFESETSAQRLQSAAAAGVRAWNGQPFPIRVELRSSEGAHFSVTWSQSLGGRLLGAARTRWSNDQGLTVTSIDLVTRIPVDPEQVIDPARVRLTAAHEMGHALGLPHSDSQRDVMYPENTAGALSARDYRTMEELYGLPDGAVLKPRTGG